jgi:hypothetical protein
MGTGLVLAFGLACSGMTEPTPPEPVVVSPEPKPDRDRKAGKRRGKAPGRAGKARGAAPPDPYVAEGACPGECCAYNKVIAFGEAPLHAAPNGRKIGDLKKDEAVQARTGEVHVRPVQAIVKHEHTLESKEGDEKVKPGDKIWILDPMGEGWGHVWYDGGVYDAEILFAFVPDDCKDGEPAQMCWAVVDAKPDKATWWVEVERKDGQVGWVNNTDDVLKGFDGCG